MKNKEAVVVTTENRGVFFGYVIDQKKVPSEITLKDARMCVYWSAATKGVLGLASTGPANGCKITSSVPEMVAYKVTAVLKCSPEAVEVWERGIWA